MFQKIPHKEKMRHIKYRAKAWERDEEKHEREVIRKMIAEKEAYLQQNVQPVTDKERDFMEDIKRAMQFLEGK